MIDVEVLYEEVAGYLDNLTSDSEGEHLWSNYETVTGILIRLTQMRNELAYLELINDTPDPKLKKFRTSILEHSIERFEKIALYESRKITAKAIEDNLNR